MPLSLSFRQTFKRTSLRARRTEVVLFCFWLALLLATAGIPIQGKEWIGLRLLPLTSLFAILTSNRPDRRRIAVTSLDDRAALKYGLEYEALTPNQQRQILDGYRVGTYVFPYHARPEEQQSLEHQTLRAYRILRRTLIPFILVYWAGWELLPNSYLRSCWTDAPVILGCTLGTILALPHLLFLWNFKDEATPATRQPAPSTAIS